MHKYEPSADYHILANNLDNEDYLSNLKGKTFDDVLRFRWFAGYRQSTGSWYSIKTGQPYNISEENLKKYFDNGLVHSSQGKDIQGLYLAGTLNTPKRAQQ